MRPSMEFSELNALNYNVAVLGAALIFKNCLSRR